MQFRIFLQAGGLSSDRRPGSAGRKLHHLNRCKHPCRADRDSTFRTSRNTSLRGNDRQPCFFADLDRLRYLDDLREICVKVKKYGTVKICERRCRRTFALIEKARVA